MSEPAASPMGWRVYVLRCRDGTFYCGITTGVARRVREHNGAATGASYTRTRRPVVLIKSWPSPDRSTATKEERAFKRLARKDKERWVMESGLEAAWLPC